MRVLCTVILRGVLKEWVRTSLMASFNKASRLKQIIEGHYQYLNGWNVGPSNVWFSYSVKTRSSTYLLFDCPLQTKDRILRRAHEDVFAMLSCPFAIDMLIVEECCSSWESLVDRFREELLHWVRLALTIPFLVLIVLLH